MYVEQCLEVNSMTSVILFAIFFIFINMRSFLSTFEFLSTETVASHMSDRHKCTYFFGACCAVPPGWTAWRVSSFLQYSLFLSTWALFLSTFDFLSTETLASHISHTQKLIFYVCVLCSAFKVSNIVKIHFWWFFFQHFSFLSTFCCIRSVGNWKISISINIWKVECMNFPKHKNSLKSTQ